MKYIINENQYRILLREDRVQYLKTQNVVNPEQIEKFQKSMKGRGNVRGIPDGDVNTSDVERTPTDLKITPIQGEGGIDVAYIIDKKGKQQVKLTEPTFQIFVDADPSRNKQYVQWIIDVFKKYALHDLEEAQRFIVEDIDQATESLTQFDCIKESKKFRLNAKDRPNAPNNPKDIRQYESIGQLYGVVSGFICGEDDDDGDGEGGDTGKLSKRGYKLYQDLMGYVTLGQAKLHKLSDKIIVYQPLTLQSSCEPLGSLSNWCTRATPVGGIERETGQELFHSYRGATGQTDRLRPTGEVSDYYVIMPIELFQAETPSLVPNYPYQFHFETSQLRDKGNTQLNDREISKLINDYPELKKYFLSELGKWAQESVKRGAGLMDNPYSKYLNQFGGSIENYISKDVYEEGVRNIKKLASQQKVPLQNNKYLKWLMENTEGVEITEFLDPENTEGLDFSNMSIGKIPDLSKFNKLKQIIANNCGLTNLPPIDYLPLNTLTVLSLKDNNITEAPIEGYEKLTRLFSLNLPGNPINKINVKTLRKMDELVRFVIDYDSVISKLSSKNREEVEKFSDELDIQSIYWGGSSSGR
jgi:hypothetical protein